MKVVDRRDIIMAQCFLHCAKEHILRIEKLLDAEERGDDKVIVDIEEAAHLSRRLAIIAEILNEEMYKTNRYSYPPED